MTAPAVVIGIGNEYRRDDGLAVALIERLARARPAGVDLVISDGQTPHLLDTWAGRRLAVVVDAMRSDEPCPGRIHRIASPPLTDSRLPGSSHALGLTEALRLASALGMLPERLVVFAVEAHDLGFGTGMHPDVAAALPGLENVVRTELGS